MKNKYSDGSLYTAQNLAYRDYYNFPKNLQTSRLTSNDRQKYSDDQRMYRHSGNNGYHSNNSKGMMMRNTNKSSSSKSSTCNCKNSRWRSMEEIRSDITYCRNVAQYMTPSSSSSPHSKHSTSCNNNHNINNNNNNNTNNNSTNSNGSNLNRGKSNGQLSEFGRHHKRYSMDNLLNTDINFGNNYQVIRNNIYLYMYIKTYSYYIVI